MLVSRLIFPVEESEWISSIVIKKKKAGAGIWVCVDF